MKNYLFTVFLPLLILNNNSIISQPIYNIKNETLQTTSADEINMEYILGFNSMFLSQYSQPGYLLTRAGFQEWKNEQWYEYGLGFYIYNDKNQLIRTESKTANYNKYFSYNENDNLNCIYREDYRGGKWISTSIDSFFYDEKDNIIESKWFARENGNFDYKERLLYQYNKDNFLNQLRTFEGWNKEGKHEWINHHVIDYQYDKNNLVNVLVRTYWLDTLLNNDKAVYEYNDNGLLHSETYYDWDYFDFNWFISWKKEYFYDSLNHLKVQNNFSNAVEYTDSIEREQKIVLTYDDKGRQYHTYFYPVIQNNVDTNSFILHEYEYDVNNNLTFVTQIKYDNGVRANKEKMALSYQTITNVVTENYLDKSILFQNFPNPCSSITNIKFYLEKKSLVNLNLYNLHSQLVKSIISNEAREKGEQIEIIDLKNIESGIYFYILSCDTSSIVTKMIVIKN